MVHVQKKLLIVDDEQSLLSLATTYFEQSGYDVKGIPNPAEIPVLLQTWMPDVILLDILMPNTNGLEVLKKLKADTVTSPIPVFIFSNLDGENEIAEALNLGAVGYLTKANYSLEDVQKKIEEILK
ncbi:MAG: two-component system, OmpR family, response regulator VicR [Parcubacteria group bacterium Gr01-1014_70]|nr:MAG: two-component system, OmpR family, response regulator VicR [Parcubacteria group bacterium Gr01-1014_70]